MGRDRDTLPRKVTSLYNGNRRGSNWSEAMDVGAHSRKRRDGLTICKCILPMQKSEWKDSGVDATEDIPTKS
jgi:hypothetical protein